MNRLLVLMIAGCSLAPISRGFSGTNPIYLCEVLNHLKEYAGKPLVFRGIVVLQEHRAFLVSVPGDFCHEGITPTMRLEGLDSVPYFAAGGQEGSGVLADVKGKVAKSSRSNATESVILVLGRVKYMEVPRDSK
jgi:hypothetical protein